MKTWYRWVLAHPILAPVAVGAALRLLAAWSSWGPFAADDYVHNVEQPWRWLNDPTASFAYDIRSPLFSWLMWLLMYTPRVLDVTDPAHALQVVYAILGVLSLVSIPGVYLLAHRRLGPESAAIAAWLMAAFKYPPQALFASGHLVSSWCVFASREPPHCVRP